MKFENPEAAFTHTLNELRYYINCGIVVLICSAAFFLFPQQKVALVAFLSTILLHPILIHYFPDMNYFVRAGWVILIAFSAVAVASASRGLTPWRDLFHYNDPRIAKIGFALLLSLVALHVIFH